MSTITGRLLRINLSDSSFRDENIPRRHITRFISARGGGRNISLRRAGACTVAMIQGKTPQELKSRFVIGADGGARLSGNPYFPCSKFNTLSRYGNVMKENWTWKRTTFTGFFQNIAPALASGLTIKVTAF
jgi:hypothetical protein